MKLQRAARSRSGMAPGSFGRDGAAALLTTLLVSCGADVLAQPKTGQPAPNDAVARAQQAPAANGERVEQKKSAHDRSDTFDARKAPPSSPVLASQPGHGRITGFDFYKDPLNADKPGLDPAALLQQALVAKPEV